MPIRGGLQRLYEEARHEGRLPHPAWHLQALPATRPRGSSLMWLHGYEEQKADKQKVSMGIGWGSQLELDCPGGQTLGGAAPL